MATRVITFAGLQSLLESLLTAPNFWVNNTVNLFTNDIEPDRDTAIADLTAPTYTGYAPQVADPSDTFLGVTEAGNLLVVLPHLVFQPTAPVPGGETIWGWYLANDPDHATAFVPQAIMVHKFDQPVIFLTIEDLVVVEPSLLIGQPLPE